VSRALLKACDMVDRTALLSGAMSRAGATTAPSKMHLDGHPDAGEKPFKVRKGDRRRAAAGKPIEARSQATRFSVTAACLCLPDDPPSFAELGIIMGAILSCCEDDVERGISAAAALAARGWTIPPRGRHYYQTAARKGFVEAYRNEEESDDGT